MLLHLVFFLSFFLSLSVPLRHLHSFPTRRSSDLFPVAIKLRLLVIGAAQRFKRFDITPVRSPRSEEHTSELQSRGHLVCRLLLEKKTQTATTKPHKAHVR